MTFPSVCHTLFIEQHDVSLPDTIYILYPLTSPRPRPRMISGIAGRIDRKEQSVGGPVLGGQIEERLGQARETRARRECAGQRRCGHRNSQGAQWRRVSAPS